MLSRWPHFLKSCVCVATARNQSWLHFRGACRLWSVLAWSAFLKQTETNEARNSNRKLQPNMCFFKGFRLSAEPCASCGSGWSLLRCSGASTWRRRSTLEERVLQVARIRADMFFLIWLILLIPLISLTNPNMFVRACTYVCMRLCVYGGCVCVYALHVFSK